MNLKKGARLSKPPEKGAALAEYAILIGLIGVSAISAVIGLGTEVRDTFTYVAEEIQIDVPGGTGTGTDDPSDPTGPTFPTDSNGCEIVPDNHGLYRTEVAPMATCFSMPQVVGETEFEFVGVDTRPVYISGLPNQDRSIAIGDQGDNTFVIEDNDTATQIEGLLGWDKIIFPNLASGDITVSWLELTRDVSITAPGTNLEVLVPSCDAEELVFTDTSWRHADYEQAGGFNCSDVGYPPDPPYDPDGPSDPDGPIIPSDPDGDPTSPDPELDGDPSLRPYVAQNPDCFADSQGDTLWCTTSNAPMPDDTSIQVHTSSHAHPVFNNLHCAYDDLDGTFIYGEMPDFMGPGTMTGMTCYPPDHPTYGEVTDDTCYITSDGIWADQMDSDCQKAPYVEGESGGRFVYSGVGETGKYITVMRGNEGSYEKIYEDDWGV